VSSRSSSDDSDLTEATADALEKESNVGNAGYSAKEAGKLFDLATFSCLGSNEVFES